MIESKKKPSLSSVSLLIKDADDMDSKHKDSSSSELYSAAIEELGKNFLNIPDDKLDDFAEAFAAAIMSCK